MKRVFARIREAKADELHLIDTPETGRELLWFLDRFPMEIDAAARARLELRAAEHRDREQAVFQVLTDGYAPPEFDLALPLRDYQRVAVDLAIRSRGLLVADDVGLGKTAEGIGLLADPRALPALIVTLTHLPRQWRSELEKFAPKLDVYLPRTGNPEEIGKRLRRSPLFKPDVFVLNYHKLADWACYLAGKVNSVIFDECQELRREDSQKYRASAEIAQGCTFRMGLSATPIYNYGGELYNVLDVLAPDALGSHDEFGREWCSGFGGHKAKIKEPKAFGEYLRTQGLMIRRTRAEVGRELPPLTTVPHEIEADLEVLDRVEDAASELARVILTQGGTARGEKLRASEELSWLLRQATGIAKARYVAEFVRILLEQGEPVLLAGWHHEVYGIWAERLKEFNPQFYTGRESTHQKGLALDRFLEGESNLLIMSLRAGAGVDGLQARCRTAVIGELDWSPGVHEQFIGRLFRDGQPDPVVAYFLLADSGSDPVVADVLGLKRQQIELIRDPDAELIEKLTVDENHVRKLAERYLKVKAEPAAAAS